MDTFIKWAIAILAVIVIGILFVFPTMWLWNWIMPLIFGLPKITFWQALGVQMLCRCLIPGVTITNERR